MADRMTTADKTRPTDEEVSELRRMCAEEAVPNKRWVTPAFIAAALEWLPRLLDLIFNQEGGSQCPACGGPLGGAGPDKSSPAPAHSPRRATLTPPLEEFEFDAQVKFEGYQDAHVLGYSRMEPATPPSPMPGRAILPLETTEEERAGTADFIIAEMAKADHIWPEFATAPLHIARVLALLRDFDHLTADRDDWVRASQSADRAEMREIARLTAALDDHKVWAAGQYAALQAKSIRDGIAREAKAREEERAACASLLPALMPLPSASRNAKKGTFQDGWIEAVAAYRAAIRARSQS